MTRGDGPGGCAERVDLRVAAFAELLRSGRLDVGWSQRDAAEAAEVSFMTVARVEAGGTPQLSTLLALCAWMKLSPAMFLTVQPSNISTVAAVEQTLKTDRVGYVPDLAAGVTAQT